MTYLELKKEILNGKFHPLYLLHGEEAFYIDEIAGLLEEKVLSEAEKGFNYSIFYGRDSKAIQIMESARRLPMMAQYQLIIVREAQYLRDIASFESYLDHIVPSTILVLVHKNKKVDGRKKVFKRMQKEAAVLYSKRISERQLPDWIEGYLSERGLKIDHKATQLLAQYLGTDLSKVSNELDKLLINKSKGETITTGDIEKNIGISKEYNVFELQDALGMKENERAYRIMDYMIANVKNNPLVVVLGTLYSYFSKVFVLSQLGSVSKENLDSLSIPPFFRAKYTAAVQNFSQYHLEQILLMLSDYDLRSKGVNNRSTDHGELLKEMTYKILNE